MRQLILTTIVMLSFIACEKKEKEVSFSVPYKAEDGSRAKATFTSKGKERTVMIEANNHKFQLDYKYRTKEGDVFERNGIKAETKGDSLFISDAEQIISLVKVE